VGTLSLGQAAVEAVVLELVRSADAFADVTLLAWHGGNAEPLRRAVGRLRGEGRTVAVWEPRIAGGDAHAGWVETSLMLALAPTLVRDGRPVGATEPVVRLLPRLREHGLRAVSENGVLGDARAASVEMGRDLLRAFTSDICALLDATSSRLQKA
jgi:creatinine amidohydrolase